MNLVYQNMNDEKEMTVDELTVAFGAFLPEKAKMKNEKYDIKRLEGNMCDCNGNGRFVLLSLNDPGVQEGQKRYMRCTKCGCHSHL